MLIILINVHEAALAVYVLFTAILFHVYFQLFHLTIGTDLFVQVECPSPFLLPPFSPFSPYSLPLRGPTAKSS